MAKYDIVLLPVAYSDLDEIFDYVLAENPKAARRVLRDIMQKLSRLQDNPYSGAPLNERSLNKFHFRMVIASPYIAFYRVIGNQVIVYRVLHGARNYPHLLQETVNNDG